MKKRYVLFKLVPIFVSLLIISCSNNDTKSNETNHWEKQLSSQIKRLGHRNWIVVADAAYPLQSNPGITTILSSDNHSTTIKKINNMISQHQHIIATAYVDKELAYLSNDDAPGIDTVRATIDTLISHRDQSLSHEELIEKLDNASNLYHVMIIKTNCTLPYTTVFYELDCGYWNEKAEITLRHNINSYE